jgi:hypothetical protein
MAHIDNKDLARIAGEAVAVVIEYIKDSIVSGDREPTAEEAEVVVWCIAGTIGHLEAYLKMNLPEPYLHNVRAFLEQMSDAMGKRMATVDRQLAEGGNDIVSKLKKGGDIT